MRKSLRCPICRKEVHLGDQYMPFCSERCKLIDLGNWASERYVISEPAEPESESQPEEGPPPEHGSEK